MQKAAEDAISHKGRADQFYALELQKIVATDVARQAQANAGLQTQLSIRSQLNGQLADGTITVAQYNDKLQLQVKLNGLNADLENADAKHKKVILDLIKQTIDLDTQDLQLKAQLNALTQEAANDNDIARMTLENSLLGKSNEERAVALAQLEALQKLKELDPNGLLTGGERANFVQSYIDKAKASVQSPFQQWARDIPGDAKAVNDALQTIEFRGLDGLASAIAGVVSGTENMKQAFTDLARSVINDIVQMTIKMLIFRAITAAFGGGGGMTNAEAQSAVSGSYFFNSAKGNVFSGGNVIPFALGGVVTGPTLFPMTGGRTGQMGEAGPEAVMPLTRDSQGRLGVRAANNNQPTVIELHVVRGEMFDATVQQISGDIAVKVVQVAAPQIAAGAAQGVIKSNKRVKLMGRG
jgi:hypothetical protein